MNGMTGMSGDRPKQGHRATYVQLAVSQAPWILIFLFPVNCDMMIAVLRPEKPPLPDPRE